MSKNKAKKLLNYFNELNYDYHNFSNDDFTKHIKVLILNLEDDSHVFEIIKKYQYIIKNTCYEMVTH